MQGLNEIRKASNAAVHEHDAALSTHFVDLGPNIAISVRNTDGDIVKALISGDTAVKFREELANHDGRKSLVTYRQIVCRKYVVKG